MLLIEFGYRATYSWGGNTRIIISKGRRKEEAQNNEFIIKHDHDSILIISMRIKYKNKVLVAY